MRVAAHKIATNAWSCEETTTSSDDIMLGRCLHGAGIFPDKGEDALGKKRFHHETYQFYFSRKVTLFPCSYTAHN
jgi:hypothetical protein